MTTDDDKMSGMPGMPTLRAGEHKARVKAELLAAHGARRWAMPRWMRVAAIVAAGALLMGAGAATREVYDAYLGTSVEQGKKITYLDAEDNPTDDKIAPGGTIGMGVPVHAASMAEAERKVRRWSDAIAAKQYRFVKEIEDPPGWRQYEYTLSLADGTEETVTGTVRLEEVSSWEEWQNRQMTLLQQRAKEFRQAVKDGRAHIVADDVALYHNCRDLETGRSIEVLRKRSRGGELVAVVCGSPLGSTSVSRTTSWQEHLDALSQGKRVLIEVKAYPSFTYEYAGADGKVARYEIGGVVAREMPK